MLKVIVICDQCKKEDRFLWRPAGAPNWALDTGKPQEGTHLCSKECALEYAKPQVRDADELKDQFPQGGNYRSRFE